LNQFDDSNAEDPVIINEVDVRNGLATFDKQQKTASLTNSSQKNKSLQGKRYSY
jgi:hypothetical protein